MRINGQALRYSKNPYSWEYIAARPEGERYRIRDVDDNAVGSAASEVEANRAVHQLNSAS